MQTRGGAETALSFHRSTAALCTVTQPPLNSIWHFRRVGQNTQIHSYRETGLAVKEEKRKREYVCLCIMKECTGTTPTYTSQTRRVYPITQNAHLNTLHKQPLTERSVKQEFNVTLCHFMWALGDLGVNSSVPGKKNKYCGKTMTQRWYQMITPCTLQYIMWYWQPY